MIRFYKQGISPLMPSTCRFLPTCSSYAMESYKAFGGPLTGRAHHTVRLNVFV